MTAEHKLFVEDEAAMLALGARLADCCTPGCLVFLEGDLGAGKTTLVRGFLRAMDFDGKVRSPTYTLLEPYEVNGRRVFHLDLYRLADPEELEWLGLRDELGGDVICLVEWPEKGRGWLPLPDLWVSLEPQANGGRQVSVKSAQSAGKGVVDCLQTSQSSR